MPRAGDSGLRAARDNPAAPWTQALAKHLGVTARSVKPTIARLLRVGLIRAASGRKRHRLFLAAGILDATEAPSGAERRLPKQAS